MGNYMSSLLNVTNTFIIIIYMAKPIMIKRNNFAMENGINFQQ